MIDELTTTTGVAALAAGCLALVALVLAVVLAMKLRRLRQAQSVIFGGEDRDLAAHAERLERGFVELRDWVEESLGRLDERVGVAETRIDGCVAYHGLVRYDAYGEMSGRQSSSVVFLDTHRSGVVLSSIQHRDQARLYVKQVQQGEPDVELSPEEREVFEAALGSTRA